MSDPAASVGGWAPRLEDAALLFPPNVRPRRLFVRGEGCWLYDDQGRAYLDFIGGIGVNLYGHGHPAILRALREQAGLLLHHSNLYASPAPLALAHRLVEHSFAERVFFTNSGTETLEAGIKLARAYARRVRGEDRFEIVACEQAFHGRSMGALACTANPKYRDDFVPLMGGVRRVPFGDLAAMAEAVGPQTAAVLVEPIQGEGGLAVAPPGYLAGLRELCDQRGCLLFFDEVQTGMGRTGRLFAYEHEGVAPDLMSLAKGLGAGLPLGALLCRAAVAEGFQMGSHGTTMGGSPVACAAGLAGLDLLLGGLLDAASGPATALAEGLTALATALPLVRGVRGRGLMLGLELDRPAKAAMDACLEQGLLVNTAGTNVLRMLPPLTLHHDDVTCALQRLEQALRSLPSEPS